MNRLTFLGTGNAFSHSGDTPAAFLLEYNEYNILLDCGPSILPSLYQNGVLPNTIQAIYISHLHPDHYFGLLFLYLDLFYVRKPEKPITIYAPPGAKDLVVKNLEIMYSEEECNGFPEIYSFHETNTGEIFDIPIGTIETLPAAHGANARMAIFTLENTKLGYSGDTSIVDDSIARLLKCDIVLHEATTFDTFIPNHTKVVELLEKKIPDTCDIYLIHHDATVIEKQEYIRKSQPRFHIPRDNLKIPVK